MGRSLRQEWDAIDRDEAALATLEDRKWALSKRLAERYAELGSYRKLADETGRSHATISRWVKAAERCNERVTVTHSEAVAQAGRDTVAKGWERKDVSATKGVLKRATPEQIEKVLDDLPDSQVEAVQTAALRTRARKANRKPPPTIGKSIPEPSSTAADYSEFAVLASEAEARADRALELVRAGKLNGRADTLRDVATAAADAWRAVASELAREKVTV